METTAMSSPAAMRAKARIGQLVLVAALPVAALSLTVGVALVPVGASDVHVVGYCLSSVIPFVLVAAQRREAIRVQAQHGVVRGRFERWIAATMLVIGLLAAGAHAWQYAWAVS
jgi:hypothetical protein